MTKPIQVKALNVPAITRQYAALSAAAPNKIDGEGNVTVVKIVKTAKSRAPVITGQYKRGIITKFSLKKNKRETKAEVHAVSAQSVYLEAGTGRRGKRSWMHQVVKYIHGSKPGMEAQNILWDAREKHDVDHRVTVANLITAPPGCSTRLSL